MKLFSFCYDEKSQNAAMAGNISAEEALHLLQQLIVVEAVNKQLLLKAQEPKKEEFNEPH